MTVPVPGDSLLTPPDRRARLDIIAGPLTGRTFYLQQHSTFLVGRGVNAVHLALDDDSKISRMHCLIEYNPPGARLLDLHSKNGTFVNDRKVLQVDLHSGDVIRAGATALRIQLPGDPAPATISSNDDEYDFPSTATPAQWMKGCPYVPEYELLGELGRGGMGVVYRARRAADGQVVALKTVRPAVPPDLETLARFRREIDILQKLDHPRIVRLLQHGESYGILYFTMDYVEGSSAASFVQQHGPLTCEQVVAQGTQLLGALEYAHGLGIVHRDVKPGNVLLARSEKKLALKLVDFGLARAYQESAMSGLTMLGTPGGTPGFMPPEQVLDFRNAQPAADQYSAAATLYYLLTGQAIYEAVSDPAEVFLHIVTKEPLPLRDPPAGPALPGRMGEVLRRALARNPGERYASVRAFRDALVEAR